MRLLLAALLRASAFVVVFLAARLIPTPDDVVGANIGLGLAVFGLYGIGAAVLAMLDALTRTWRWVAAVWVCTALLVGMIQPLLGLLEFRTKARTVLWEDYTTMTPFLWCLIMIPALMSATLTSGWRHREALATTHLQPQLHGEDDSTVPQ